MATVMASQGPGEAVEKTVQNIWRPAEICSDRGYGSRLKEEAAPQWRRSFFDETLLIDA
jgi:hypothetical protein